MVRVHGLCIDHWMVIELKDHPFGDFFHANYPLAISTDDSGVFNITLTNEYHIIAETFQLGRRGLFAMAERAVDLTFATEQEKQVLRLQFAQLKQNLISDL